MKALECVTPLALLLFSQFGQADPLDTWTWRYPVPPRLPLRAVTYGNGQFVAVGDLGVILTSTDRVNWVQRFFTREEPSPNMSPGYLSAITYGNGQFVAVGTSYGSNVIITSADGANWVKRFSGIPPSGNPGFTGIAYGNGQFVAVGFGGFILTSSNGINWSEHDMGMRDDVFGVAYANGQFVAVSWNDAGSTFAISQDGVKWVSGNVVPVWLRSIAYGNGQFVAVGADAQDRSAQIFTSSNGVNWVERKSGVSGWLSDILYDGGRFVTVGCAPHGSCTGTVLTSADGVNWVQRNSGVTDSTGGLAGIGYGNGQYVAVGGDGLVVTSDNGIDWVNPLQGQPPEMYGTLSSVGYGNGRFVAVGSLSDFSAFFVTSADGASWDQSMPGTTGALKGISYGIAYGNGLFVAVTGAFSTPSLHYAGEIVSSADGVNWVKRFSGGNTTELIHAVAYGNSLFVVSRFGGTLTSSDGIRWVEHQSAAIDYVNGLAYGNGQFAAVGISNGSNVILTSADGTNWVQRFSAMANGIFTGIAYGNGQFVALGAVSDRPVTVTSADGMNWVLHQGQVYGNGIAYGNGQFVVVGGWLDSPPSLYTSSDGVHWVARQLGIPSYRSLNAVAYGNGHFVAVGRPWMILQSGSIINLEIRRNSTTELLSLSLEGPTGLDYTIQTSTDLISWRDVTKITGSQSSRVILEDLPAAGDRVFYRSFSQ